MSTLKEQALIIRNETIPKANTASRIGDILVNIVDEIEGKISKDSLAQETGSSTTTAMSQDAVTKELAKRISKDSLAQETGSSTTTAMSQDAVSSAINAIDKVYFTSLDITTKITGYTISAEEKEELENIRTKSSNMAIYCKSNSSWYTISYPDGDIWDPILKALIGTKIYTVTNILSPTTWKISFVDLASGGTETGNGTYVTSLNIKTLSGQSNSAQITEIQNIIDAISKGQVIVFNLDSGTENYNETLFLSARRIGGIDNRSYYLSAISTEGVIYKATTNVSSDIWGGGDSYGSWTTSKIDMAVDNTGGGVGRAGTGTSSETFNNTANTASGNYAHAEGDNTTASGHASHAEGQKTQATGYASHAEGGSTEPAYQTHAAGKFAHAEGNRTSAAKDASHSEGYATTANAPCSHVEGNTTTANGEDSHAEGNTTVADGLYAHAEGHNTTARGKAGHAEGNGTKTGECTTFDSEYKTISTSNNDFCHAEGNNTSAGGLASHAEGEGGNAYGRAAHVEGQSGAAIGLASHAEGELTMACGEASHAEGQYTQAGSAILQEDGTVKYTGTGAHAEGYQSKALGDYSHAEGRETTAKGNHSHAEGYGTMANNANEHAQGIYNSSHENYLPEKTTIYSVGIGTNSDLRKNAIEIMKNGDVYILGIGGYNGSDFESAKTVQSVISELIDKINTLTQA